MIDNSFSMRAGTRLADAKREALSVLSSRSPADRGRSSPWARSFMCSPSRSQDSGALRAAVEGIQPGDSRGSFGELARAVRSLAESVRTPIELHLFSDMQQSNMPANFSGTCAARERHAGPASGREESPCPTGPSKASNAPGPGVGYQESSRPGRDCRTIDTPAATRTVSLVVNGKTIATNAGTSPPTAAPP